LATLQRISGSDRTEHRKSAEKQTVHSLQVTIDFGTAGAIVGDVLLFSSGHFTRVFTVRWLGLGPGTGGRYLLLNPASLIAVGNEHNFSRPVIRLWNDDHHVERSMPIASHDQLQVSAAKGPTSGMCACTGVGLSDCRSE
jgi:hypothetical protein